MMGTKMREFNSIAVRFQIITRLNRCSASPGLLKRSDFERIRSVKGSLRVC
jgi:hypothetical protein